MEAHHRYSLEQAWLEYRRGKAERRQRLKAARVTAGREAFTPPRAPPFTPVTLEEAGTTGEDTRGGEETGGAAAALRSVSAVAVRPLPPSLFTPDRRI